MLTLVTKSFSDIVTDTVRLSTGTRLELFWWQNAIGECYWL